MDSQPVSSVLYAIFDEVTYSVSPEHWLLTQVQDTLRSATN
jgi:hypothetical protein